MMQSFRLTVFVRFLLFGSVSVRAARFFGVVEVIIGCLEVLFLEG